ncbi:MAG: hypothetical protein CMP49_03305, partial [Flavobacteriales bacterium]|nr:hypothetical protein [Flavobacteriales bacterium]
LACNYNSNATEDDESCIYEENFYDCLGNCNSDIDNDGICDELEIFGCMDFLACNYNSNATEDDESCIYEENFYDCLGNCNSDIDNDGICDELEIFGCTDTTAINFNENATEDDGTCLSSISTQSIPLEEGWNMWSTYINQTDDISLVFDDILQDVIIIKDQNGNVYWPEYDLNSIGNLVIGAGYQIKMNTFSYLTISGVKVPFDTTINLGSGWSIIGYLHDSPADISQFFESYSESVVIIKNESGNVYWPEYNLNSIGNMLPGEGYQIKSFLNFPFSYQEIVNGRIENDEIHSFQYFEKPQFTDNNMTILLPELCSIHILNEYDEIAVFDKDGLLVGASIISEGNNYISVWGDDLTTDEKDGLFEGDKLNFQLWNSTTGELRTLEVQWSEGSGYYLRNGISKAGKMLLGINQINSKKLIRISDCLGKEINNNNQNTLLFYIYDDGSIQKRYTIK